MNLISQGFWTPKAGSSEADYEDAIAIGPTAVAIADGATESSFARAWAQALTEGFACEPLSQSPDLTELMERVTPLQQKWHAGIAWDRLPWFAEDKARNGAFAALLTLCFEEPLTTAEGEEASAAERRWHALAVGDTCLFQIRADRLHTAFPLEVSAAFDSSPLLLSSNPARNLKVWDHAQRLDGTFQQGDILLLMTDALAKWFLMEVEAGARPWETLCALTEQSEFAALTAGLRADHRLKNDDTSVICIRNTSVVVTDSMIAEPMAGKEGLLPLLEETGEETPAPVSVLEEMPTPTSNTPEATPSPTSEKIPSPPPVTVHPEVALDAEQPALTETTQALMPDAEAARHDLLPEEEGA